jgi:competence protein ComEC
VRPASARSTAFRTSTSAAWLEAVDPALLVISCGRGNRYGHPHADVLARAAAAGVPTLRTDLLGTITLRLGPGTPEVRTYQPGRGWSAWSPAPWAQGVQAAAAPLKDPAEPP